MQSSGKYGQCRASCRRTSRANDCGLKCRTVTCTRSRDGWLLGWPGATPSSWVCFGKWKAPSPAAATTPWNMRSPTWRTGQQTPLGTHLMRYPRTPRARTPNDHRRLVPKSAQRHGAYYIGRWPKRLRGTATCQRPLVNPISRADNPHPPYLAGVQEIPIPSGTCHCGQEDTPSWYFLGSPLALEVFLGMSRAGRGWRAREVPGAPGGHGDLVTASQVDDRDAGHVVA